MHFLLISWKFVREILKILMIYLICDDILWFGNDILCDFHTWLILYKHIDLLVLVLTLTNLRLWFLNAPSIMKAACWNLNKTFDDVHFKEPNMEVAWCFATSATNAIAGPFLSLASNILLLHDTNCSIILLVREVKQIKLQFISVLLVMN